MTNGSNEIYKGQRKKEKYELFNRFKLLIIENHYKSKFFDLFNYECFKCGIKERLKPEVRKLPVLCIDHHIPMALGGHLIPGNLVSLCRGCNLKKRDRAPEDFYTMIELKKLKPLLEKQKEIFDFNFNWDFWSKDQRGYLISLGISKKQVEDYLKQQQT